MRLIAALPPLHPARRPRPLLTPFLIPDTTRQLLGAALRLKVCDAADILAVGARHRSNFEAIHEEILEWALASRHTEAGRTIHTELVGILEATCSDSFTS